MSLNDVTLCRAGSLHIPADSGNSSLITTFTCHSLPLSIIWAAKHRRFPTRWGSAVTTSIASSKKLFRKAWKKRWRAKKWIPNEFLVGPPLPFTLFALPSTLFCRFCQFSLCFYMGNTSVTMARVTTLFSPPMCDYSGESGIVYYSGRMPHWGTAAGKASGLTFKCELNL